MSRVLVVGSGATGVHFALTALERGHAVTLLDVGYPRPTAAAPEATFAELPSRLVDPVEYFNGVGGDHVVYPSDTAKFFGFPPAKDYVFRQPEGFRPSQEGFEALLSFAQGGLAEAWTGGVYELNRHDLGEFPFAPEALTPGYAEVARRIGISAAADDLVRFSPLTAEYQPPLPLDPHGERLMARYAARRPALHAQGFYFGRSRVAVLSRDLGERRACDHLGRCLWGCPRESLYGPASSLRDCQRHDGFTYLPGRLATHFEYDADGRLTALLARPVDAPGDDPQRYKADIYVLAAGTLCSSQIYLASIFRRTGRVEVLPGLLDNRMAMVPFLTPVMIGRGVRLAHYQFHQLALALEARRPDEHVHGQVTTLKAAAIHPIVQGLPLDLRTALRVFRGMRGALGVVNLWLHDRRRPESRLTLEPRREGWPALRIEYRAGEDEPPALAAALRRAVAGLKTLGAWAVPGMTRVLPKGASVHYAGTLPMTHGGGAHTLTPEGRSRTFPNLIVADGAGFPFLPAKNLTFTLMANAGRIAGLLA